MTVVITGMGIISSLGKNIAENRNNLFSGKTFIGTPKYLQTKNNHFPVGEVKYSDESLQLLKGNESHYLCVSNQIKQNVYGKFRT